MQTGADAVEGTVDACSERDRLAVRSLGFGVTEGRGAGAGLDLATAGVTSSVVSALRVSLDGGGVSAI